MSASFLAVAASVTPPQASWGPPTGLKQAQSVAELHASVRAAWAALKRARISGQRSALAASATVPWLGDDAEPFGGSLGCASNA